MYTLQANFYLKKIDRLHKPLHLERRTRTELAFAGAHHVCTNENIELKIIKNFIFSINVSY